MTDVDLGPDDPLWGPVLKFDHSINLLRTVGQQLRAWKEASPRPFAVEVSNESDKVIARVSKATLPPAEIRLGLADALHALRTSLDHLAWQAVLANGRTPGTHTSFPIPRDDKRPTAAAWNESVKNALHGAHAHAISFVASLEPFAHPAARRRYLWMLNALDNYDEHRLLPIVVMASGAIQYGRNEELAEDFRKRERQNCTPEERIETLVDAMGFEASVFGGYPIIEIGSCSGKYRAPTLGRTTALLGFHFTLRSKCLVSALSRSQFSIQMRGE